MSRPAYDWARLNEDAKLLSELGPPTSNIDLLRGFWIGAGEDMLIQSAVGTKEKKIIINK